MKQPIFILCFLQISYIVLAQKPDSSNALSKKSAIVRHQSEQNFFPARSLYESMDTSFYGSHQYFPNNFQYSYYLSARRLHYDPSLLIGFRHGIEFYDFFGYTRRRVNYYHTRAPFTSILLVFGQKKEQYSKILHTQNITKQLNIALSMLRIRSEGFYNRQNIVNNNICVSAHYTTKNNRYAVLGNGIIATVKTDENGGIKNDTLYEATLNADKKLFEMNLSNAHSKRVNKEGTITQFLNFGKKDTYKVNDSTVSKRIIPVHYFSYSLHAQGLSYLYKDATTKKYYQNSFFDSITHDSTHVFNLKHAVTWSSYLAKNTAAKISFEKQTIQLVQYAKDSVIAINSYLKNNLLDFSISNKTADTGQKFIWNIGAQYILNEPYKKENRLLAEARYYLKPWQFFSIQLQNKIYSPTFVHMRYTSNHLVWSNNFKKISEQNIMVFFVDTKHRLSLSVHYNTINNYVYFDSTCKPYQNKSNTGIYLASIQKHFTAGKFNLKAKAAIQNSNSSSIHLPPLLVQGSFYFQDRWFKKTIVAQLGVDVNYFALYYADAYMPAMGVYYWQNKKQVGNYPFLDFFFAMKIKKAKVFLKVEHFNSGFTGTYYLAPHLPAPDRSIKLGLTWDFFD